MPQYEYNFTPEQLQSETWLPVLDYEGWYSVSNLGRVRRETPRSSNTGGTCKVGRVLQPWLSHGYLQVSLMKNGQRKSFMTYALVAGAFIGRRPEGMVINHIDGVKTNCAPENLEYITQAENERHAVRMGLKASGLRNGAYTHPEKVRRGFSRTPESIVRGEMQKDAKLTNEKVKEMRQLYAQGGISYGKLAKRYGVCKSIAMKTVKRQLWKHIA